MEAIFIEAEYHGRDLPRLVDQYEQHLGRALVEDRSLLKGLDAVLSRDDLIALLKQLEKTSPSKQQQPYTPSKVYTPSKAADSQFESTFVREELRSPSSASSGKKLQAYEHKIFQLETQVESLTQQNLSKSQQVQQLKSELSKQKQLLTAQQQDNVDKLREVNSLRMQMERYARQCQQLEEDLSKLQKSKENIPAVPQTPLTKNRLKAIEETPLFKQLKEEGLDDRILEVLERFEDVGNVQTEEMLSWLQELKADVSALLNDVLQQVEALKQVRTKYKTKIKSLQAEIAVLKQEQPQRVDQSVSKVTSMLEQKNLLVKKLSNEVDSLNFKRSPWMMLRWLLFGCLLTVFFVVWIESGSEQDLDYFPDSVFIQPETSAAYEWLWALIA